MGYCYDRATNRLCCDCCGNADGTSRRRKCPAGWCPAQAVCSTCWAKPDVKAEFHQYHLDSECKRQAAEWAARKDRIAELEAAGIPVRCSAVGIGDGVVQVTFRAGAHLDLPGPGSVEKEYVMADATYHAIPLLTVATVDDYRAHGEVLPLPVDGVA